MGMNRNTRRVQMRGTRGTGMQRSEYAGNSRQAHECVTRAKAHHSGGRWRDKQRAEFRWGSMAQRVSWWLSGLLALAVNLSYCRILPVLGVSA
jgi:hypothetical protein